MPHPKIHEEITKAIFGSGYLDVHEWIDGAFDGTNGRTHWIHRHHEEAINQKYSNCGMRRKIAKFHVMVDWMWYHHIVFFPKKQQEVIDKLREHGIYVSSESI